MRCITCLLQETNCIESRAYCGGTANTLVFPKQRQVEADRMERDRVLGDPYGGLGLALPFQIGTLKIILWALQPRSATRTSFHLQSCDVRQRGRMPLR